MSDAVSPLDGALLPAGFLERVGATANRLADVERFRGMLEAGNARMNLVGPSTLPDFWMRHFVDSAQLLWFAPGARTWADLGAGAGLPGVVLAILLKGREGAHVHLVESMAKRCGFLREAVEALGLSATVHQARAEDLKLKVEVVTARACAPLTRLLGYAAPYLAGRAKALFLKGESAEAEVAEASVSWRFESSLFESLSDPRGRVIELSGLAKVRG